MREILFRGKFHANNKWYFGDLETISKENGDYRISGKDCICFVIPETVGQFTGLLDKNGNKIFEGDIVVLRGYDPSEADEWEDDDERWDEYPNNLPSIIRLKDIVTMDRFPIYWLKNEHFGDEGEGLVSPEECEVIGNIHDNPELLEVQS